MKFGTNLYKFTQYGEDLAGTIEFVRKADELGYHHMRILDHVVGIVAEKHGGIASTPYTAKSYIHECFTLMAYLSALTKNIKLMTGVLVLPQRQTPLVAKQAAEVDILSGGRLLLGIGIGYNPVEFGVLGADFANRARRFEEQVEVLRAFWTQDVVNYKGQWHTITDASLAPLPKQRPIPLWFGLGRMIKPIPPDAVLERIARLADGWLPLFNMDEEARKAVRKMHAAARAAGRDPETIEMEMSLFTEDKSKQQLLDEIKRLRDFGASRLNLRFAVGSVAGHIEALKRFREVMDAYGNG